jgi:hypothetical protein
MTDAVLASAVAAAVRVCAPLGLPAAEPSVLQDGSNVLVRVGSVVVRVATTTALVRPGVHAWLARDIALARFAADRGLPVVRPLDDPLAGPHHVDGFALTVWPFTPHEPAAVVSPAELGLMLGELHAALRESCVPDRESCLPDRESCPPDRGSCPPDRESCVPVQTHGPLADVDQILRVLDARDAPPGELAQLGELAEVHVDRAAQAAAALPRQVLHGDPHPGNVLVTPGGPRWIDFEDTWCGPVAWDLACLAGSSRLDGQAAVDAYPARVDPDELAPFVELRGVFGICWGLLLARRFPHHREPARERLEAYLRAADGASASTTKHLADSTGRCNTGRLIWGKQ